MNLINEQWVLEHVRHRSAIGHKKSFGHVLVIAGTEGKAGAAILCAKAALHAGCGMVTAMIPKEATIVLLEQCPEIMYVHEPNIEQLDLSKFDAIVIGPGLGFSATAVSNLKFILNYFAGSVVIDADALTIVSSEMSLLKSNHIITPHPGEFARLQGFEYHEEKRLLQAQNFVEKYPSILVLKGAGTLVGSGEMGIMHNTTGNDGMATAGSGDVLAGIIGALCAQKYSPFNAAAIGVYIHGIAGDNAVKEISKASLVAGDIITYLGGIRLID
jgi:NAD(P)H-hydrate epimerase